jgi:hypothetical protein
MGKKIVLLIIGCLFYLFAPAQINDGDCGFIKKSSITYYLDIFHTYVNTDNPDNLRCFCKMSDSLSYWSKSNSFYLVVLDSIYKIADGGFGEYGATVVEELYNNNFEMLANYFLTHKKSSFLSDFEIFAYDKMYYKGADTVKTKAVFINNLHERIDSLKISDTKKQGLKDLLKL